MENHTQAQTADREQEAIRQLFETHTLPKDVLSSLLAHHEPETAKYLFRLARGVRLKHYGNTIYIRGLIEYTNYCKNNCYYCGIRCRNKNVSRYRLSDEEILQRCRLGYDLGFRTFVLQGGEDFSETDAHLVKLISQIKNAHPDCAITLSLGEKSRESFQAYFDAGADRYLLRHETAVPSHYAKLHPENMRLENRIRCLYDLKEIGFQTGSGFMVGSPYQTPDCLAEDFLFLKDLEPEMIGIGPFIPQQDTPFKNFAGGTLEQTLFCIGLLRLMFPKALIPATTALGTIHPQGREKGILAGANVIMPNLSPETARQNYTLYDNKLNTGAESAEGLRTLKQQMQEIGYKVVVSRGDSAAGFRKRGSL